MKIEKAIYGLAADFEAVHWNVKGENVEYFHVEPSTVQYAGNVAFTLEHEPKQTITTTKNEENGQLIIVQKGPLLFFKFIPTTNDGERIYRYVKLQKWRKCSYFIRKISSFRNEEAEKNLSWVMDSNDSILTNHGVIFEICLTNKPRDKTTFCTTDVNDPRIQGIDWNTNVELQNEPYWEEYLENENVKEMIKEAELTLKRIDDKISELYKRNSKVGG